MNHPFLQDLCAALVLSFGHFLWIGMLIAVVAAVVARRQATAANRYGVWLGGLIAMAASPFVTLVVLMAMPSVDAVPASTPAALVGESVDATTHGDAADEARRMDALVRPLLDGDRVDDGKQHRDVSEDGRTRASILQGGRAANGSDEQRPSNTNVAQRESAWWRDYAPVVTSLYLIGVALMGLRLAFGLWGGRRLRNQATLITERSLLDALQRQAAALGMRFVPALAYCERVAVPTVLGILKPMVLLPVSLASGLAPDQIESVLAHELAHLRRYDHLVNLMQCVIESLLFFHPAVWWVSRRIRDEREHCCDDLVIASGAVPLDYAASLLRVAELSREAEQQRGPTHRRSCTAASLFATGDRPSTLRQRIARLLGDSTGNQVRLHQRWPFFGIVTICLMLAGSASWIGWSVFAETTTDQQTDEQTKAGIVAPDAASTYDAPMPDDDVKVDATVEALEPEAKPISFTQRRRIRSALREITSIAFVDNQAEECLPYLGDLHGIEIELTPAARTALATGDLVTLRMEDDELRSALSLMLPPLGLTYMIDGNRLLITTPADLRRRGGTLPFDDSSLLAKLEQKYPNVGWRRLRRGDALAGDSMSMQGLMIALHDGDPRIQEEAAKLIWRFEEAAQAAVPFLEKLSRSDDPQVRRSAYRALARIGRKDLNTFPIILAALERGDAVVLGDWISLANIYGVACLPHIEAAYPNASAETRKQFLLTILPFRDPDHDLNFGLVRLGLTDSNAELRLLTLNVATHARISEERTTAFRPFLHSESLDERLSVTLYFAFTESEFKPAIDVLLESAFSGRTEQDRRTAWGNLRHLDKSRNAAKTYAVERLRAWLDDLRSIEGMRAAGLVIHLTPHDATDLIQRLAAKVREGGVNAPTAADVLANANSTPDCRTALGKALAESDVAVRLKLAQATRPVPYPAYRITLLLILLDDPDSSVVEAALTAVATQQPADPATLAKLNTLAESGSPAIHTAVQRTLSMLVISPSKPREMNLTEWGTVSRDGLRTQLVLLTDTKAVGQPLLIGLRVKNDGTERRSVAENQAYDGRSLEVIGPDGKPVESLIGDRQIHELAEFIEPGETLELADLDPRVSHGLSIPGSYTIRFVGDDSKPPQLIAPQTTRLPKSNALSIKLTTAPHAPVQKPRAKQQPPPDGNSDASNNDKPKSYVANLPDGLKVEFVGVTKNTAPANEGWKPDGTSIGDVGYWRATTYISGNTTGSFIENGEHPEPNAGAIDLMFRFRGLKAQPSLSFELAANGGSYSHWPVKDPYELRVAAQRRGPSAPGNKWSIPDGEMRVGVTDEPWGRYVKISPEGKTLDPIQPDERHASTYGLIEVLGTRPHDRAPTGNTIVLRRPLTDADSPTNNEGSPNLLHRFAFEFRAIDTDGKNHWADSWRSGQVPNTKLMESLYGLMQPLPASATLSHYEYRLRPYRHWVTFKGVSLEPGKETDVKVSVESLPEPAPQLRVLRSDGSPATFNSVGVAAVGFPTGKVVGWFDERDKHGMVSLAKLPAGTHWLVAAADSPGRTVFQVTVPSPREIIEQRLRNGPSFLSDAISFETNVRRNGAGREVIAVSIRNHTQADITVSEADIALTMHPHMYRVFSPRLAAAVREPLPRVTIAPGKVEVLELDWPEWVRAGLWASRITESIDELWSLHSEPGKIHVRVDIGNHGGTDVLVTDPRTIASGKPPAVRGSPDPARPPTEGRPNAKDDPDQPATKQEGVIEDVADKAIVFEDGRVVTTDATTTYSRLTDKGEEPAERKALKAGVRVRYELVKGKGATKVVILPAK